jgi:hypothetical protein
VLPFAPATPFAPLPAVSATLTRLTGDALTNAAMLEFPLPLASCPLALCAVNPMSSNVTPTVSPVTCSAYPAVVGATTAGLLALYVHVAVEQSSPP